MINEALKPKDQMKPRGQEKNKIRPKPTVEGDRSCFAITKTVVSNGNKRKAEYANIHSEHMRSLEGVSTCNRQKNAFAFAYIHLHTGRKMQIPK